MTNEIALIINAIILTGGSIFVFIITLVIGYFKNKKKAKTEFFYTLLPRRLKVYEDICCWIHSEPTSGLEDNNENLKKMLHSLLGLTVRSNMYCSKEICLILDDFIDFIKPYMELDMNNKQLYDDFVLKCGGYYNKIFDCLFSISFPPFIDESIKPFEKQNQKIREKSLKTAKTD